MSTIILYKNNKTLRLPILKFIASNKKYNEVTSKKTLSNNNSIIPKRKETLKIRDNKNLLNLSTLPDLQLNSEKFTNKYNLEKSVQTIQTSFINNNEDKFSNKNCLFSIMEYVKLLNKDNQKRDNNTSIIHKDNLYKINRKKRKKLLENYSQINHHFNIYYKKVEKNKTNMIDIAKINLNQKYNDNKRNKNRYINYRNKFDLNKTQEGTGKIKVTKRFSSIFHNAMLKSNINKDKKLIKDGELYNNESNNELSINKNNIQPNNSFSNLFLKYNSQKFIKEHKNKLIKSNGRFLYSKIKNLKYKLFI